MPTNSKLLQAAGWKRVKWKGSDAPEYRKWEVWEKKFGNSVIDIFPGQWPDDGLSYGVDAGRNSDLSHSGFLKGVKKFEDAAEEIERRVESNRLRVHY